MLSVQGRYGADVLGYSESLEAVSATARAPETIRGMGYWLAYVRDPFAATTTAALDYMSSAGLVITSFFLVSVGAAGLAITRWSQRRFAALLVLAGTVLAVGVYPIDEPSPLMSMLASNSRSAPALASAQQHSGAAAQHARPRPRRRCSRRCPRRLARRKPGRIPRFAAAACCAHRGARRRERARRVDRRFRRSRARAGRRAAEQLDRRRCCARRPGDRLPGAPAAGYGVRRLPLGLHGRSPTAGADRTTAAHA